jgi:hypothetical protein
VRAAHELRVSSSVAQLNSSATAVKLPRLNLRPKPQACTAFDEVDDRPRHVLIPTEVRGHAVRMAQSEQRGDFSGVDQIIDVDLPTHRALLPGGNAFSGV